MNAKHADVEGHGDDNQAECSGKEVLEPLSRSDVVGVSKQNPELQQGQDTDPCDGKQANPFDRDSCTQAKASSGQPEPP